MLSNNKYFHRYTNIKKDYIMMLGGNNYLFKNSGNLNIHIRLEGGFFYDKILEIQKYLNNERHSHLHMTILDIHINNEHKYSHVFKNRNFRRDIINNTNNFIERKNYHFKFEKFGILGDWVVMHLIDENNFIKDWRPKNYKILNHYIKQQKQGDVYWEMKQDSTGDVYWYYDTNNNNKEDALYAQKEYYFGIGRLNPHISIIKLTDTSKGDCIVSALNKNCAHIFKDKFIKVGDTEINKFRNFNVNVNKVL